MPRILKVVAVLFLLFFDSQALASERFLVIGVIHSKDAGESVALVKDTRTSKTSAVREGMNFDRDTRIVSIGEKKVELETSGRKLILRVGGGSEYKSTGRRSAIASNPEITVKGSTVRISATYRDHLVKNELAKILMEAAAVPQFDGGQLRGFKLWDLEPDSIYEQVGFQNGDIVTSINDQELIDVGSTIRLLQTLKNESNASVTIERRGKSQTLEIHVE